MAGRLSAHRAGHAFRREPLSWLADQGVYAVSGIAEPGAFHEMLSGARARVLGTAVFNDHHRFAPADVERVSSAARRAGADWIITTEKDIMRLRSLVSVPANWVALGIDFAVEEGFFDLVFGRVTQARS
jgi:tetraacyldisaccharide 4'-kinase